MAASLNARLDRVLRAAIPAMTGVSIGDPADRTTWRVSPPSLQAEAQPYIDAFDPDNPQHEQDELSAEVKVALDKERLASAIVWTVIDTYSAPATITKYNAARTKIIAAFKSTPWK